MKKLVAMLLSVLLVFGLAACKTINDKEVSILWADDGVVRAPNSMINAMERAMYTENIGYAHYGAKGDQATQTKQAEEALNKGCAVLMVDLVDGSAAQTIVDLAKAKSVPVVFFDCEVSEAVLSSYDKCALINSDVKTVAEVQGKQIADYLTTEKKALFGGKITYENFEATDRNDDGKISYLANDEMPEVIAVINKALEAKGLPALVAAQTEYEQIPGLTVKEPTDDKDSVAQLGDIELILTNNDTMAMEAFYTLQAKGFNKDKLATHCIPIYTVGDTVDYKALALLGRPEGEDKDKAVQEYYESVQYVVDLRNVKDEDLDSYIYTTTNVIGSGRIAGTVIADYDSMAAALATIAHNLIKGADAFKNVDGAKGKQVLISYVAQ